MKTLHLLTVALLPCLALAYIDIDLETDEAATDVLYNMPMAIGSHPYRVAVSL